MTEIEDERERLSQEWVDSYNRFLEVRPTWFGQPLVPGSPVPTMPEDALRAQSAYYDAQLAYDDFVRRNG